MPRTGGGPMTSPWCKTCGTETTGTVFCAACRQHHRTFIWAASEYLASQFAVRALDRSRSRLGIPLGSPQAAGTGCDSLSARAILPALTAAVSGIHNAPDTAAPSLAGGARN